MLTDVLGKLNKKRIIETDVLEKFKLEQQIVEKEGERKEIERKLEELDYPI